MKSVWRSGRKASRLCVAPATPLPRSCPEPIAILAWMTLYALPSGSRNGSRNTRMRSRWYSFIARNQTRGSAERPASASPPSSRNRIPAPTRRAQRPTANQASWRKATLPPARPMCRLASVVALRITRPPMAPSSGQSTFCSSRRSIPPRTVMEKSLAADVEARDLLEKDRVVDRARDRRGHGAAVASTLDEHHDHDLGIPHRRERGEPCVVLPLLRFRVGDRLRRPGLARDLEAGNARGDAGAIGAIHDRPHALAQERPDGGIQLDVPVDAAGVAPDDAALGPLDALHEARLPEHASVGDGGHEARDLHRRGEQLSLADRHVHGLAGVPHG